MPDIPTPTQQPAQTGFDYSKLGEIVQAKYPQYAKLPADQVGQLVAQKYPQYQALVGTDAQLQNETPSVGGFVGNVLQSGADFVGGAANAILHPIKTIQGLGSIAAGAGEELSNTLGGTNLNDQNTQAWDAVTNFYKQRYGSPQNFLHTLYKDPVGVAADASALLGVTGGAAKLAGAQDVANVALKASDALNPINVITKPLAALGKGFSRLQDSLEESSLRLTPTQKTNLGAKLDDVTGFISENVPVGTPETRYNVVTDLYNTMEKTIQKTLQSDDLSQVAGGVPKPALIQELQTIPDAFRNDTASFAQVQRQVNEIMKTVETTQPDVIPLTALNDAKRSFFGPAFDSLGVKLKSEVKLAIGDTYKNLIETSLGTIDRKIAIPDALQPLINGQAEVPIAEFNKLYGTIITARKFLKLAQGKPEAGLVARVLAGFGGGIAGSTVGGPIGAFVGAEAGNTLARNFSTPVRSAVGKAANVTGKVISKAPAINTGALVAGQVNRVSSIPKVRRPQSLR